MPDSSTILLHRLRADRARRDRYERRGAPLIFGIAFLAALIGGAGIEAAF